jgi:hypothetical protein
LDSLNENEIDKKMIHLNLKNLKNFCAASVESIFYIYSIVGIIFIGVIFFSLAIEQFPIIIKKIFGITVRILFLWLILFILAIKFIPVIIRKIPRAINWVFVIGFVTIGLVFWKIFPAMSLIFIVVGILISPYTNELLQKTIRFTISAIDRAIVALLACVIVGFLLLSNTDENRFVVGFLVQNVWIDYDNDKELHQLRAYLRGEELKNRKEIYFARRKEILSELQFWHKKAYYQEVVDQGSLYINFNPEIRRWVKEAKEALKEQQIKTALQEIPQLMKEKKYREVYKLAMPLQEVPELKKHAALAKKNSDKNTVKLRLLYEKGQYKKVIKKGTPHIGSDCRIRELVNNAQKAMIKAAERKRIVRVKKKINQLIKARKYDKAIKLAKESEYVKHPELQSLITKAKKQRKKADEKKILARLRKLSPTQIARHIREYSNLVKLMPENKKYQDKLNDYKKNLIELRKQPALLVTQKEYGKTWPFTVSKGKLECFHPGIVTFRVEDKTYAVNGLASSRGYSDIDEIWKDEPNQEKSEQTPERIAKLDLGKIIYKGLDLCNPIADKTP